MPKDSPRSLILLFFFPCPLAEAEEEGEKRGREKVLFPPQQQMMIFLGEGGLLKVPPFSPPTNVYLFSLPPHFPTLTHRHRLHVSSLSFPCQPVCLLSRVFFRLSFPSAHLPRFPAHIFARANHPNAEPETTSLTPVSRAVIIIACGASVIIIIIPGGK